MKNFVIICVVAQFLIVNCAVIPEYIEVCRKSEQNYADCLLQKIEKQRPLVMKGIPELGLPPMDPFELPIMNVDRAVNDLVKIKATLKDIKVLGGSNVKIENLKADPYNMTGEIRMTLPWSYLTMEYDVNGQLLIVPLKSKGFFRGNFTNTKFYIKGNLKLVQKEDKEYFQIDQINSKITVGDGYVKLTSKNPAFQIGADLISNFFNENPRRTLDAINPIFVEASNDLFKTVLNDVLGKVPAKEWVPE